MLFFLDLFVLYLFILHDEKDFEFIVRMLEKQ